MECGHICGQCLYGGICDKVTGACDDGCYPGYQGVLCQEGKTARKIHKC